MGYKQSHLRFPSRAKQKYRLFILLDFLETDKVFGIGEWKSLNPRYSTYEISYFLINQNKNNPDFSLEDVQIPPEQARIYLDYQMGGLLGYYSLNNLFSHIYSNTELDYSFMQDNQVTPKQIAYYLQFGLVHYNFGGITVNTTQNSYLWGYENNYTRTKSMMSPLEGGVNWKSTASYLFALNNTEYIKFATPDDLNVIDTGIKTVQDVRQMRKVYGDRSVRNKKIIYSNPRNNYTTSYYYYPFGKNTQVEGSQYLGFSPNMPDEGKQYLYVFDPDMLQQIRLSKTGKKNFNNFNTYSYVSEDQIIDLTNTTGYPLIVTLGAPDEFNCNVQINGLTCQEFLMASQSSNEILVEAITGNVVSLQQQFTVMISITLFSTYSIGSIYLMTAFYQIILLLQSHALSPQPRNPQNMFTQTHRQMIFFHQSIKINSQYHDVKSLNTQRVIYFIIFLTMGCVFSTAFIGGLIYYCKNKQNFGKNQNNLT